MDPGAKELWLFTMRFPYGSGEPFLESELPILCERFSLVRIFPMFRDEGMRALPENTVVEDLIDRPYVGAGPLRIVQEIATWPKVLKTVRASCPDARIWRKHWPEVRTKLRQSLSHAHALRRRMAKGFDPDRVVLYSYWTYDWATVLGILKLKDDRIRFVSRMLGFDLFTFRSEDGWPPFRTFHLEMVDRVFIISQAGMDHMREHYPAYAHKFQLSYLGSRDHGIGPWVKSDTLRLVSCSRLVPLKRVHLIVEALGRVRRRVEWTHFGSGEEEGRIKDLVKELPRNIDARMMGGMPNAQILAWYRANAADAFIHVSSTEGGAPVALQEAASFGIPLIAIDSGGVREIVNERTGMLLSPDADAAVLAETIEDLPANAWYSKEAREQVRAFWSENFRADVVYGRFAEELTTA